MPRHLIRHQQLSKDIAAWLAAHPEHEFRESVERAEMSMATPGQWEVAKVTPDVETESQIFSNHDDDQGQGDQEGQGRGHPEQPSLAEPQSEGM